MKRSRRPLQATRLILAGLVCFLAIPLLAGSLAWAASPAGWTTLAQTAPAKGGATQGKTQVPMASQTPPSLPAPITPYVAQAYSIVGPIYVSSISSEEIHLYTGHSALGIELSGKNLVVMDQNSKRLSISAVQKGTRVSVCRKDNNVVVVVLPDVAPTKGVK